MNVRRTNANRCLLDWTWKLIDALLLLYFVYNIEMLLNRIHFHFLQLQRYFIIIRKFKNFKHCVQSANQPYPF